MKRGSTAGKEEEEEEEKGEEGARRGTRNNKKRGDEDNRGEEDSAKRWIEGLAATCESGPWRESACSERSTLRTSIIEDGGSEATLGGRVRLILPPLPPVAVVQNCDFILAEPISRRRYNVAV